MGSSESSTGKRTRTKELGLGSSYTSTNTWNLTTSADCQNSKSQPFMAVTPGTQALRSLAAGNAAFIGGGVQRRCDARRIGASTDLFAIESFPSRLLVSCKSQPHSRAMP